MLLSIWWMFAEKSSGAITLTYNKGCFGRIGMERIDPRYLTRPINNKNMLEFPLFCILFTDRIELLPFYSPELVKFYHFILFTDIISP